MLHDLTQNTGQRDWPIICGVSSITFLKRELTPAVFQSFWLLVTGVIWFLNSFKTTGLISSGPEALSILRFPSKFRIPFVAI